MKHSIDVAEAIGHGTADDLDLLEITITFDEECPDGGWHIESGVVDDEAAKAMLLRSYLRGKV